MRTLKLALVMVTSALISVGHAQWPARYDHQGGDDVAKCIAVDKRGNVYVAGTVATTSNGLNGLIHSYTSAGYPRDGWPRTYNGTGNGDDRVAAIHVDDDLNVYVAGTSQGDGTGYDFFVWKLNTNGGGVWPTSGGGTGYAFDSLGALRTTNSWHEGYNSGPGLRMDMAVREAASPSSRTIAVTGVFSNNQFGQFDVKWRTIVFEQNSTGTSASIKSGWPMDLDGQTNTGDYPNAVSVHSDNTVYVAGMLYETSGDDQQFSVIRYPAGGGSPVWSMLWPAPGDAKYAEATDLVLDRDGNAYATGFMGESNIDYATTRIPKDWNGSMTDTGLKLQTWDNSGRHDYASSIDLTYEVESGVIKPYIVITGTTEASSSTSHIATIRYSPHTTNQTLTNNWTNIFGSANSVDDVAHMVVGAGYGNAYVVGRSGSDYLLLGYRRSGTALFTPPTFNFGYFEEARALAMAGAGHVRPTGDLEEDESDPLDFITAEYIQTVSVGAPEGYADDVGFWVSGVLADLEESDNEYMVFVSDPDGRDISFEGIDLEFPATSPISYANHASEIVFRVETKCSDPYVRLRVEALNVPKGEYDVLDSRFVTTTDTNLVIVIKDDPHRYITSSSQMKVRLVWDDSSIGSDSVWSVSIDQLSWELLGP